MNALDLNDDRVVRISQDVERAVLARHGKRLSNGEVQFLCPAHDDSDPSANFSTIKHVWNCHACNASGGLMDLAKRLDVPLGPERREVRTYDYTDLNGKLLFQVVRYEPKSFRQRRPDGDGGWVWNMSGIERVLYKLPDVVAVVRSARRSPDDPAWAIFLTEGEKDAEAIEGLGLVGSSASGGAGKWRDEYVPSLEGGRVVVIADKDEPGRNDATTKAASLCGKVRSLKVIEVPGDGKDAADWIAAGGTKEELLALVEQTPEWEPERPALTLVAPEDRTDESPTPAPELHIPAGWLRDYVEWAGERTDAPTIFHLAVGLSVLGTVLGNRAFLRLRYGTIFPNLWIVLVAGSSYMRKSTAIGFGTRLLADVNKDLLLPNQFTMEALVDVLSVRQVGLLTASEFGAFMEAISGREYNSGGIQALTDLYDVPAVWQRKIRKEDFTLQYPCLSLLGGSTITWLKQQIQAEDLAAGFAARLTFWTAKEKLPFRRAEEDTQEAMTKRHALTDALKRLSAMPTHALSIEPAALAAYNDWCERHENEEVTDQMRGLHVRLETAALKLAIIIQASYLLALGGPPDAIGVEAVQEGTRLADLLWVNVQSVVEQGLGSTKSNAQVERIRGICQEIQRKSARVAWSELLRKAHMRADELRPIVATLEETDELFKLTDAEPGKRGATYVYQRPPKL
jgi:Protein of unknown function (DUF3987)